MTSISSGGLALFSVRVFVLVLSLSAAFGVSLCWAQSQEQSGVQRDIPIAETLEEGKGASPFGYAKVQSLLVGEETGRQMIDYPSVKLRSLDKITARTVTFEAQVGSTLKFGPIFIKVQACRKSSPLDEPEAAAFLQVWEVTSEQDAKWIFSGWMFASSPGLSAMDHPIYDVWVMDCMSDPPKKNAQVEDDSAPEQDEGVVREEAVPAKPQDKL